MKRKLNFLRNTLLKRKSFIFLGLSILAVFLLAVFFIQQQFLPDISPPFKNNILSNSENIALASSACNPDACAAYGTICCPGIESCVKWWEDEQNCGSCGNICPAGSTCQLKVPGDYTKGASCQGCDVNNCGYFGLICCPGVTGCVKWWEDEQNCGRCGNICPAGSTCQLNVPGDYTKGASCIPIEAKGRPEPAVLLSPANGSTNVGSCSEDDRILLNFAWSPANPSGKKVENQYLDISTQDGTFAPGTFIGAKLSLTQTSYETVVGNPIGPLDPGTRHWWRINTKIGGKWYPSPVWQFTTKACGGTLPPPPPSAESCQWDGSIISCSEIYNIPMHNTTINITNTEVSTRQFAEDISQRSGYNVNSDFVINWAKSNGWNPAFIVALWGEESGFTTNIGYMACMESIQSNLNCWKNSSLYPVVSDPSTSFVDLVRIQWCATNNPVCSNNPYFFKNVTDLYLDLIQ